MAVGIIPKVKSHALRSGIAGQFLHPLMPDARIPPGIHQHRFIAHGSREIHIFLLLLIVHARVATHNPAPRATAIHVRTRRRVLRFHHIESHRGLSDGRQRRADGNGAPRRFARQHHARIHRPVAIVFTFLGETNGIRLSFSTQQTAGTITAVHACLGNQHPSLVTRAEQAREGITFAPTILAHRVIHRVGSLIAGRSAGKPAHGLRLRAKERGAAFGQDKARGLFRHYGAQTVALRIKFITECHIVAAHVELHVHHPFPVLVERTNGPRGLYVHVAALDGAQVIFDFLHPDAEGRVGQGHALRPIAQVRAHPQRGILHEHHAVVCHIIYRTAAVVGNRHTQLLVRRRKFHRRRTHSQTGAGHACP